MCRSSDSKPEIPAEFPAFPQVHLPSEEFLRGRTRSSADSAKPKPNARLRTPRASVELLSKSGGRRSISIISQQFLTSFVLPRVVVKGQQVLSYPLSLVKSKRWRPLATSQMRRIKSPPDLPSSLRKSRSEPLNQIFVFSAPRTPLTAPLLRSAGGGGEGGG